MQSSIGARVGGRVERDKRFERIGVGFTLNLEPDVKKQTNKKFHRKGMALDLPLSWQL